MEINDIGLDIAEEHIKKGHKVRLFVGSSSNDEDCFISELNPDVSIEDIKNMREYVSKNNRNKQDTKANQT